MVAVALALASATPVAVSSQVPSVVGAVQLMVAGGGVCWQAVSGAQSPTMRAVNRPCVFWGCGPCKVILRRVLVDGKDEPPWLLSGGDEVLGRLDGSVLTLPRHDLQRVALTGRRAGR